MTPQTRKAALRAAAKVALAGALASCSKSASLVNAPATLTDGGAAAPLPTLASATAATDGARGEPGPPQGDGQCDLHDAAHVTKAELTCCAKLVDSETGVPDASALSPAAMACCQALVRENDVRYRARGIAPEFAQRGVCCAAANWAGSLTCTPWGPPMPPAMDWDGVA